jgi:hypothetical protein
MKAGVGPALTSDVLVANPKAATPAFPGRTVAGLAAEVTPAADEDQAREQFARERPLLPDANAVAEAGTLTASIEEL